MARSPIVPTALTVGPFTLDEARRAGLERWHLKGASWKRVGPITYKWAGLTDTPIQKLEAARLRLPQQAAFSGLTAAWLHGLDVEPCAPIEATVPPGSGVSARVGIEICRSALERTGVVTARGLPAIPLARAMAEVCGRLSLIEAVVLVDMALHCRCIDIKQLKYWADEHPGRRGIRRFRQAIGLADAGAESPMESRLRMVLVLAGLPPPKSQVPIHDHFGRFAGRPDLYYE